MQAERWKKIESIFQKALEHDEAHRAAVIEDSCAGDESLRREVESLLAHHKNARKFIETPALESPDAGKSDVSERAPVALQPGMRLGDYEIQKLLGSGGMGEVYRARDTRLGRDVAIKVLRSYLSGDADRLRRFEQEAKAAAALNHPNILAVHQLGTHQGAPYLISELLEGSTLREQLARGPLPIRKGIDYGVQIGRGLAAAHERGIVHRDLKPENLFATKDGRIKILDFGLAKLIRPRKAAPDSTLTAVTDTELGVVMGTVGYMSPEQVRGNAADHRSDIFSFGAILYEMLSGKRAFQKPTSAETMSAIINEDPPAVSQLAVGTPPALRRVVQRCLEKNPEQRFQSASDLAFALEALSDSGSAVSRAISPQVSTHGYWKWIAISSAAVLIISGLIAWQLVPSQQPRVLGSTQLTNGSNSYFVMATDGSRLYFTDVRQTGPVLAQMSVNGGDVSIIPTIVKKPVLADVSSDHSQLLVGTDTSGSGDTPIWSQPLPSGSPRRIGDLEVSWAEWSPDGRQLVFTTGHDLYIANVDGSGRRKLCCQAEGYPAFAYFSPDGTRIRFSLGSGTETSRLWEVRTDGSNLHQLLPAWRDSASECCGRWTPDGRYYVFTGNFKDGAGDIFVLRESRGLFPKSSGQPTRLTFGPLRFANPLVSLDQKKIFVNGWQSRGELVRYDRLSKQLVPFLGGIPANDVSFSRDGKWIAYVNIPDGSLWRSHVDGSERLRLTFGPETAALPRWSPDGKSIAFMLSQNEPWRVYLISADGGSPKLLLPDSPSSGDPSWSRDGNQLAIGIGGPYSGEKQKSTIGILDVKTGKVSTVPGSDGIFAPRWSPDGRFMAALSVEPAMNKLLLYNFQSQKWKTWVSDDRGIAYPAWTTDGQYVQYRVEGENPAVWRVKVGETKPEMLFSIKDPHLYSGPFGVWGSTAPDNSVMLVRVIGSQEIYALDVDFP